MEDTEFEDIGIADPDLIDWVKKKVVSLGISKELMGRLWEKDFDKVLSGWVLPENFNQQFLYIILDEESEGEYSLTVQVSPFFSGKRRRLFVYFFKEDFDGEITVENVDELISYGCIKDENVLDSLLEIVQQGFAPKLFSNSEWPDSVRKDFCNQLHKFLGSLTEATYREHGSTVLYIPSEQITNIVEARKQKDLIQRLETTLIKWTSQIKEVVQEKDIMEQKENARPLSEIEYWRARTMDLMKLKNQINSPQVRTILEVLNSSSYLSSFNVLAGEIQKGYDSAKDNLKFLSTIKESCLKLSRASPPEIPHLLPGILNQITMIWNLSSHYHTGERITSLLKKISNEIIFRCSQSIDVDEIFEGDITEGIRKLKLSIEAGEKWKQICRTNFRQIKKNVDVLPNRKRKFQYDHSSVFAEIDAFVHRCHDLIEVCESQLQLGNKCELPLFSGSKGFGQDIPKSLRDIRAQYQKLLNGLKSLEYDILDVKSTAWHDDYGKFKSGIRDLELIMVNVLTSAFMSVRTIDDGVELLEGFTTLAKREHLKNVIQLKTSDLYSFFLKEMEKAQSIFEIYSKNPPIEKFHPKFSGAALWANKLLRRITRGKKTIDKAYFLSNKELTREKNALDLKFEQNTGILSYYIRQMFEDWKKSVGNFEEIAGFTAFSILKRNDEAGIRGDEDDKSYHAGVRIILNAHPKLISTYKEYHYWSSLPGFNPPEKLKEILGGDVLEVEETFRVHMENVKTVVRSYNSILDLLEGDQNSANTAESHGPGNIHMLASLFSDRIKGLDLQIGSGIDGKVRWNTPGKIDRFVTDALRECMLVKDQIIFFREKRYDVVQLCKEIASTMLIEIDSKTVFTERKFTEVQRLHRKTTKKRLVDINNQIIITMKKLFNIFRFESYEIHQMWWKFAIGIESRVDVSLRESLKLSFNLLSDAINGERKMTSAPGSGAQEAKGEEAAVGQNPLFFVNVELSESEMSDKKVPVLTPSMEELEKLIETTQRELTKCVQVIVCLVQSLEEIDRAEARLKDEDEDADISEEDIVKLLRRKKLSNYSESIKSDSSFRDPMISAYKGIKRVDDKVRRYIEESWTSQFERLWRSDREVVTKRLMYKNKPSVIFEQEYQKYSFYLASVRKKSHSMIIGYLQLDFTTLKEQTAEEAELMMKTVLEVLHSQAKKGLDSVYETIRQNINSLGVKVVNRDGLKDKIDLLEKCKEDVYREGDEKLKEGEVNKNKSNLEKKFEPIYQHYEVLKKYVLKKHEKKVLLADDELEMLENLEKYVREYEHQVKKSESKIKTLKDRFKVKLQKQIIAYDKNLEGSLKELRERGPYGSNFTSQRAFAIIQEFQQNLLSKKNHLQKLKDGAKMFTIQLRKYSQLKELSKELELLNRVWQLVEDWTKSWELWKTQVFRSIDPDSLKKTAGNYIRNVNILAKNCESWGVWKHLQGELFRFKNTLPLILDLKNKAMRSRHWDDLYDVIPGKFDYMSDDFNLEKIIELNFESYAEDIRSISNAARQELNIETGLSKIAASWKSLSLNIVEYREVFFRVIDVETVFQQLDDDSATLSVMKLNPYVTTFLSETNDWEKTLTLVAEVLENLMKVQEIWLYLLNIFEVDDISKQLPTETASFRVVNSRWRTMLKIMKEKGTVLKGCSKPALVTDMKDMHGELEYIQKQLDDYLEIKRQEFPRFYFLSDRDLLQVLGQSKTPAKVQRHLQNCFGGINSLKLEETYDGRSRNRTLVARGVYSKEGEYLPFTKNVNLVGRVEKWLGEIESAMRIAVRKSLKNCYTELLSKKEKDVWIRQHQGQLVLLATQLYWTKRVEDALKKLNTGKGRKSVLKDLSRRTWDRYLKKYSKLIRKNLDPITRQKLISLITIEVHHKDVIEGLVKTNCVSAEEFDWEKQLRFYWDHEIVVVKQTSASLNYDYEYLGPTPRLVITPLTERCYMTLTTAIHLSRGGNPKGPAGTGKTETVKDLSKNIGKFCIVFNCSRGLDIGSMARMFSGLVQTGAWSCFDEFNRIDIEVLSVVAQQIGRIIEAIIARKTDFLFEGKQIAINASCGIFCTMNPGYAGRTELPDNLKALLRPIAMMRPDSSYICEIFLYAQGFTENRKLSKKITTLYELMAQQLSKQRHYDFGLRAIKAVLTAAGELKRMIGDKMEEEVILLQACREMNLPKFIAEDIPLFLALLSDLFPGVEEMEKNITSLKDQLESCLVEQGLQIHEYIVEKAIQLFETKKTRHGVMVVGMTCSGKTTAWKTLLLAMNTLAKSTKGPSVSYKLLNPKALSNEELYGYYSKSRDWRNGVLSEIMKESCKEEKGNKQNWIVFDGPVDTLWIESMNTVLDDTKTLTLISGERIALSKNVSLLFEVKDLSVASPATVSRCGMVFFDENRLGWEILYKTWAESKVSKIVEESEKKKFELLFFSTFTTFIKRALFQKNQLVELVSTNNVTLVKGLFNLFDSLNKEEYGINPNDPNYAIVVTKFFVFSLIWSIGATVNLEGRRAMDMLFREFDPHFPAKETVYEYYIDEKTRNWRLWEEKIPKTWKPKQGNAKAHEIEYYNVMVPTVDTVRNTYVLEALLKTQKNVLVIGDVGTGKTSVVKSLMSSLPDNIYNHCTINFSAGTSSNKLQAIIESKVEKKSHDTYAPISGKRLVVFVDDFNMPQKDIYGSQPPLELMRMWVDNGFWYDRVTQSVKKINNVQLIAAMGPPGGGREDISPRLQSRFNIINVTFPNDSELKRIYSTLMRHRLEKLEELKTMINQIVDSSIDTFKFVCSTFRPTPDRSHYVFNLRDLSKVFNGILSADQESMDTIQQLERLWVNECFRVFHDRLINEKDRKTFREQIENKLLTVFGTKWSSLFYKRKSLIPFGRVLTDTYQEMKDEMKLVQSINHQLFYYNNEIGVKPMKLVLFSDAIDHVCRISRIINQPNGHALLIGVGGSGRSSLTKLAAYMAHYDIFEIEITNNYGVKDFHESLKEMYKMCGFRGKNVVFLIKDNQFIEDFFLEDINNMLSSGEVPNLFEDEELAEIYDHCRTEALRNSVDDHQTAVYEFFVEKVKRHLHVVVCMSPVGGDFRKRIRMFPALVNCTTIDWFDEWPQQALKEVAFNFLKDVDLSDVKIKKPLIEKKIEKEKTVREEFDEVHKKASEHDEATERIADIFVVIHNSVREESKKMLKELKRYNYVTPTNYLELVTGYIDLLKEKKVAIGQNVMKLEKGVNTLEDARNSVLEMRIDLAKQKEEVALADADCENLMQKIMKEQRELNSMKEQVNTKRGQIQVRKRKLEKVEHEAARELEKVQPELDKAIALVNAIDTNDILELRSYQSPPKNVEMVLVAVMIVVNKKPNYEEAKAQMVKPSKFISMISNYKHENMSNKLLARIKRITSQPKFKPDIVRKSSAAIADLCLWVVASENYGRVWKLVKPKKDKLESARLSLNEELERLNQAEMELQELNSNLKVLEDALQKKREEKEHLTHLKENTEKKLNLAKNLVGGLKDERERWKNNIADYKQQISNLPGDVLLASAFLSYCGPFTSEYRMELQKQWFEEVVKGRIPHSRNFSPKEFLIKEVDIQSWVLQGLPSDSFSGENGAIVQRGRRWPLMIDPQGQANKWIKNLEKKNGLEVTDFLKDNFLRNLENAIVYGRPVLIQDVPEEIDPSLDSVIAKASYKKGNRTVIKLGDKELDFNPNFKLFMTTRLPNPHFKPEICTRTTIVNFSVTRSGLEEQLLVTVVKKENPELEKQKNDIVTTVAEGKKTMVELEDAILQQITTQKDLLNEKIINTLQKSKKNSEKIKEQLKRNEKTEKRIDELRDNYRPAAVRASILYFVLCDLSTIDPMYQFSLVKYIELFENSINESEKPRGREDIEKRVELLNKHHTYEVYKSTCQGLFEKDKLLFSFHLCAQILLEKEELDLEEYNFFLGGGVVLDKESQMINPCVDWLPEKAWDNFFELDKLINFRELVNNIEENAEQWMEWFKSTNPETYPLPSEWQSKCGYWERMMLVRCCREDRLISMIKQFIIQKMDSDMYVKSPSTHLGLIYEGSNQFDPFIFILSKGVDPLLKIEKLAKQKKVRLNSLSLGQNQEKRAMQLMRESISMGEWVYLANCHLMMSWMPQLEKMVDELPDYYPSEKFRLWLSSKPHKKFSISILQKSRKITLEPSSGVQNGLGRLMNEVSDYAGLGVELKKALFSLMFYHSILLERAKFGNLGWNKVYDFNDSDFHISKDILSLYFLQKTEGEYADLNWAALRFLIGEISYGGRVTDDHDQLLLNIYTAQSFNRLVVEEPMYKLTESHAFYMIPREKQVMNPDTLEKYIDDFPLEDPPIAFGQHFNADISSQIQSSNQLLKKLMSMNPIQMLSTEKQTPEEFVRTRAEALLYDKNGIPDEINLELAKHGTQPLNIVLIQESNRYNNLLQSIKKSLKMLVKAIKGDIVMTRTLEDIFNYLYKGRVPEAWMKLYPSLKNLPSWIRDLQKRINQMKKWAEEGLQPKVFWLSGFIFPTGFLTAVKQTYARQKNISVDQLTFEFIIMGKDGITQQPKEGVYVNGLLLEGAGWDEENHELVEPEPMQLLVEMPTIWFKPIVTKKKMKNKDLEDMYACPVYYFPKRNRQSFVEHVDLRVGHDVTKEHWIKRGTAMILSDSS